MGVENNTPMQDDLPEIYVKDIKEYDGTGPDGRILIGLHGKVFDVTKNGSHFYKKGGPYGMFAGKDATRGLSSFSLVTKKGTDEMDLTQLKPRHYRNCLHWEKVFTEKYELVGRLKDGARWNPETVESYLESLKEDGAEDPSPNFQFLASKPTSNDPNNSQGNGHGPKSNERSASAQDSKSGATNGKGSASTSGTKGPAKSTTNKVKTGDQNGNIGDTGKGGGGGENGEASSRKMAVVSNPKVEDIGTVQSKLTGGAMGAKKKTEKGKEDVIDDEVFVKEKGWSLGLCTRRKSALCTIV